MRLGRLIQVIPYPVLVGFTSGIGVVIGVLQLKDFLGLRPEREGLHFVENALLLGQSLPGMQWQECVIGASTLVVLLLWKRLATRIPDLIALLWGAVLAVLMPGSCGCPRVCGIAFHGVSHPC